MLFEPFLDTYVDAGENKERKKNKKKGKFGEKPSWKKEFWVLKKFLERMFQNIYTNPEMSSGTVTSHLINNPN